MYKFAVARMAEVAGELMTRNQLRTDTIDWLDHPDTVHGAAIRRETSRRRGLDPTLHRQRAEVLFRRFVAALILVLGVAMLVVSS